MVGKFQGVVAMGSSVLEKISDGKAKMIIEEFLEMMLGITGSGMGIGTLVDVHRVKWKGDR